MVFGDGWCFTVLFVEGAVDFKNQEGGNVFYMLICGH